MRRKGFLALAIFLSITLQGCNSEAIKQFLSFLQQFSSDLHGIAKDIKKTKKKQLRTLNEIEKAMSDIKESLSGRFGGLLYKYSSTELDRILPETEQFKILKGIFGSGIKRTDEYQIVRKGEIKDAVEAAAHRLGNNPEMVILYASGLLREFIPAKENLSSKLVKMSEKVKTRDPSTQKALIETKELNFRLRAYSTMLKNASLLLEAAQKIQRENKRLLQGAREASRLSTLSSLKEKGLESLLGYRFFRDKKEVSQ